MRIKYDISLMKFITLFESLTQARVKDCIDHNGLLFVVEQNELGKAVGRRGVKVQEVERALQKRIKVVEFNPDLVEFVKNLILPLQARDVQVVDEVVIITGHDTKTKGLLIGRNAQNLRFDEDVVKRYFPIKEIKVV